MSTAKINNEDNKPNIQEEQKQKGGSGSTTVISTTHDIRNVLGKDDNVNFVKNVLDKNISTKWSYDGFPLQLILEVAAPASPPKRIDYVRIVSENEQPYKLDFSNENIVTAYSKSGGSGTLKKGLNDIEVKNTVVRYIRFEFSGNKKLDEDKNQKPDPLGIYYVIVGQGEKAGGALPAPIPTPVPAPTPEPLPTPTEGRVKDWGGDINKGAKSWKAVVMRDDTKLYKVVDASGTNIADMFTSQTTAQQFIAFHIQKQGDAAGPDPKPEPDNPKPKPDPKPNPDPQPGGTGVTKDGVQIPYETTGKMEYTFKHNDRDDGKRMDFNNLKAAEYVNAAVIGYFAFPKDNAPDDEVSGKFSAMSHSGSNRTECFDMGMGIKDGATRIRYEAVHPEYTGDLGKGQKGLSLKTKFIGYMFTRKDLPNGNVLCEQWQDQGDNEGTKPSNKWVKLFSWNDPKYQFKNYKDGHTVTIRVDGSNVVKDMKLKWLALVELKA